MKKTVLMFSVVAAFFVLTTTANASDSIIDSAIEGCKKEL